MSLEAKIEALTSAVEALTEQVKTQNATVAKALGAKGTAPAAAEKPAAKPAAAEKPAAKPAAKPSAKAKAPTAEDIRGLFGPYLAGASDKATKKRLIETTKPLLEHFGVDKITEVAEEQRAEALKYGQMLVDAFEEDGIDGAEAVKFPFSEDDGDDGDDDGDEDDDGVL
jgi:hypothetical protein